MKKSVQTIAKSKITAMTEVNIQMMLEVLKAIKAKVKATVLKLTIIKLIWQYMINLLKEVKIKEDYMVKALMEISPTYVEITLLKEMKEMEKIMTTEVITLTLILCYLLI